MPRRDICSVKLKPDTAKALRVEAAIRGITEDDLADELIQVGLSERVKKFLGEVAKAQESEDTIESDLDTISTDISKITRDKTKIIKDIVGDISKDNQGLAPKDAVLDKAEEMRIERSRAEEIIDRIKRNGDIFEPRIGMLKLNEMIAVPESSDISSSEKKQIKGVIEKVSKQNGGLASKDAVLYEAEAVGIEQNRAIAIIDKIKRDGDAFEPRIGMLKLTHL